MGQASSAPAAVTSPAAAAAGQRATGPQPPVVGGGMGALPADFALMGLQLVVERDAVGPREFEAQLNSALAKRAADPNLMLQVLVSAAQASRPEKALLLIERGAPVNGRVADERTPLHFAAAVGRVHVVTALLAVGADPLALSTCHSSHFREAPPPRDAADTGGHPPASRLTLQPPAIVTGLSLAKWSNVAPFGSVALEAVVTWEGSKVGAAPLGWSAARVGKLAHDIAATVVVVVRAAAWARRRAAVCAAAEWE
jgi:hypothetical protein